ncbi:MAG: hypothetical protein H0U18_04985 [Pyrinomonadaceae bacterium]|jgi:hypothetical protein|nr:hypothetical protein [Pyrinomonadaceae bacterium]
MESQKLRIKIGEHEFEAEGPAEQVAAQFEAWKELVASLPKDTNGSHAPRTPSGRLPKNVTEVQTPDGFAVPWDVFEVDEKRKLVTLKVLPTGEDREAVALLLLLFGHRKTFEQQEVLATRLIEAMQVSGFKQVRVDRTLAKFVNAGLVLNSGQRKGSKYRLTNTGYARAEEEARELFARIYISEE